MRSSCSTFTHQFVAADTFPLARLDGTKVRPEMLGERNHQSDSMFCDRRVIDAGRKQHRQIFLSGVAYVDRIETDAVLGKNLQLWQGSVNHLRGNVVVAVQEAVERPFVFDQVEGSTPIPGSACGFPRWMQSLSPM